MNIVRLVVGIAMGIPLAILIVYILVRVVSAAWFRSKKEFYLKGGK